MLEVLTLTMVLGLQASVLTFTQLLFIFIIIITVDQLINTQAF